MGSLSAWHWAIIVAVVLVVFGGKGRISGIMGDVAQGLRSFRREIGEEERTREESQTIRRR